MIAIFTPEVAEALIEKGFLCLGKTEKAWYFKDNSLLLEELERVVESKKIC